MSLPAPARLSILLQALAFCLVCAATLIVASISARYVTGWPEEIVVGLVGLLLALTATVIFLRLNRKDFKSIGLAPDRRTPARLSIGLAIGFGLVAIHSVTIASIGHVTWIRNTEVNASGIGMAALGYGLLAWREEIAFRAYPLRTLVPAFGLAGAQLIVIAVFVAEHRLGGAAWSNAVLGAGLGALVFGMAALATRGIALPLGLHAAWNIGDWARGGKGDQGVWIMQVADTSASYLQCVAMASYVLLMLGAFVGFLLWLRRRGLHRPFRERVQ